jgi:RimJ/RimL family protein N-acetyltransferase
MDEIILRKFKISDLDDVLKGIKNDNVLKDLGMIKKAKEITRLDEKRWLKDTIKNYTLKKPTKYSLAIIVDNKLIGSIGLQNINYKDNNSEFGYWIAEPYWNKGYITNTIKKFVKIALKKFRFVRIYAYANECNIASQRVLEKNGFKLEAIRKKAVKKGNLYINDKQYALVK